MFLLSTAFPSGYEGAFEMGPSQSLGNGVYTATLNQVQTINKNNLAQTEGVVAVYIEVSIEPLHDKTNKMTCAPSEDSDQPGHLPSLIRAFACPHEETLGP